MVSAKSVKSENKTIKKNEKRLLKDNFQPTAKNDRQNKEDRDEDDDDNKKISASSKSDGLNQNREKKCEKIAWGHLIAPGWLKKNFAPVVSGCQNIPWGIVKKWSFTPSTTTPDITAPILSDIKVIGILSNSAIVYWETNEPADTEINYGKTTFYGKTEQKNALTIFHIIYLTGLEANTVYHYRITSQDKAGNAVSSSDASFKTLDFPFSTNPPQISSIISTNIGTSTAIIKWATDKLSTSKMAYGTSTNYTNYESKSELVTYHMIQLSNLLPDTFYYFIVSSEGFGGAATSTVNSFKTLPVPDSAAPIISDITVGQIGSTTAAIAWNTNELSTGKIYYSTSTPFSALQSNSIYSPILSLPHHFNLYSLSASTTHYYLVESKDQNNNTATSSVLQFTTAP